MKLSTPSRHLALRTEGSGGHILGFDGGGYYVSNGTYALHVGFEGGRAVAPLAAGAASTGGDKQARPLTRVTYSEVWRGIDVTYDAPPGGIVRSTWTVAPGAEPAAIRLRYNVPAQVTESGA